MAMNFKQKNTENNNRILFLTLRIFSKTGGIEKACRILVKVLDKEYGPNATVYSMYDATEQLDKKYAAFTPFSGFNNNKWRFGLKAVQKGINSKTIILSHINLLLFGKIINYISPKTKIILWAHGIEVWRPMKKWKQKFIQEKCTVWAVSNFTKSELIKKHQVPSSNIKVLNNALDPYYQVPNVFTKPTYLLKRYGLDKNQHILFTLTRLSASEKQKNYDLVIHAISELKNSYKNLIYIIGGKSDEKEQNRLESLIKFHHLEDRIKLIGFVDEKEITDHFLLADTFILPSKKEGFGIVFIEAAVAGCSVIGGNVDGSTDALLDGKIGQLIDPDKQQEIVLAIQQAIEKNTHDRLRQQQTVLSNFGFDKYQEKIARALRIGV